MLLDSQGNVKLCDFGISGRLVDSKAFTRGAGAAAYMAVSSWKWEREKERICYSEFLRPSKLNYTCMSNIPVIHVNLGMKLYKARNSHMHSLWSSLSLRLSICLSVCSFLLFYYLQPERINITECPDGYDVRADVWSLGISLVELSQGKSPYSVERFKSEFELLTHIVNSPPPLLVRGKVSEEFYDFVAQWWVVVAWMNEQLIMLLCLNWMQDESWVVDTCDLV